MQQANKETLKIFWQHSKKYKWHVAASLSCLVLVTALRTYSPILYRNLINLLINHDKNLTDLSPFIKIVIAIFFVNLVRVSTWRGFNFIFNYFQPKVMAELTNTCYAYLHKHSYNFFNNNFVGSLVTKVKRFERAFEQVSDQLFFSLGRTIVEISFITAVLLWRLPKFGIIVLIWSAAYISFAYFFAKFKLPYDIKRAEADTKTTAQLADSITNNLNIKLFTHYYEEVKKFFGFTNDQFRARKKSWDLGTIGEIVQNVFHVTLEFFAIYSAIIFWQRGLLSIGDIVLLQSYLLRTFDILWDTGKNIRTIYEAMADANEMTEILLTPFEVKDLPGAKPLQVSKGQIVFRNVDFAYHEGLTVLQNFNLKIQSGQRVALIGPSGGGKSTIVKILFRFFDLQDGEILIDNQNIARVSQESLRANISLVPQEPVLFHRSLMDNIRYGKPQATDEEVIKASGLAHCHEFISSFPEAYQTFVGERGVKLSGGERQRVAIARAILKNAPILVLDEATSSLDSESEMLIQDALKSLMKNKTTIVIAHRLSTIMQMDRIIVLENGRITEEGDHEHLLKIGEGTYQKLWRIQAGGFAT